MYGFLTNSILSIFLSCLSNIAAKTVKQFSTEPYSLIETCLDKPSSPLIFLTIALARSSSTKISNFSEAVYLLSLTTNSAIAKTQTDQASTISLR